MSVFKNLKKDHGVDVHFGRVAVLEDQILKYKLPTRPTKKSDPRANGFIDESVEIDAMPMKVIRQLAVGCITRHIDEDAWQKELDFLHWISSRYIARYVALFSCLSTFFIISMASSLSRASINLISSAFSDLI
jgi:hypothetical protein